MVGIKEYLKDNILITDGAMGTYYLSVAGKDADFSELANINQPEVIKRIHEEYVAAGAKLIRTNTFSANTVSLDKTKNEVKRIIQEGYSIAKSVADKNGIYVAADIGPVPEIIYGSIEREREGVLDEYRLIIDTFLEMDAGIFVFETFSSTSYLDEVTEYIKSRNKDAFILVQFAINKDGHTRREISVQRINKDVGSLDSVDAYGFNCGTGPAHLYQALRHLDFVKPIVSTLPNAGYPEIVNERTVYRQNPEYFADKIMDIKKLGVKILGGCCGTTPVHIKCLVDRLGGEGPEKPEKQIIYAKEVPAVKPKESHFSLKMRQGRFSVAVELDPPADANLGKIMDGARVLRDCGVDIITISDSPLARVRMNSIMVASKIKREVGIDTMPHISCRDKNIIALKSDLLGAYAEGIRNVLVVTGDPVSAGERGGIKSVFNLNSFKLIELISQMNEENFYEDPIHIGGALNLNVLNRAREVERMLKKKQNGAGFFLTQPVFEDDTIKAIEEIRRDYQVRIFAGIMPVVSYRNAVFLNNEIPGIRIPQGCINRFHPDMTREEAEEVGVDIAVSLAHSMKKHVDGFYFITPFNRAGVIEKILNRIKCNTGIIKNM